MKFWPFRKKFNKSSSTDDEAVDWIIRKDRTLDEDETKEFNTSLQEDPFLADSVRQTEAAWELLKDIPEEVAEEFTDQNSAPARSQARLSLYFGLAAVFLLGLFGIYWFGFQNGGGLHENHDPISAASKPWTQRLPDGSLVRLNTGAQIEIQYDSMSRRVGLLKGEAHFTVTKNPDRPFIVEVGQVFVRAVGTSFNVVRGPTQIDVMVTEGIVEIDPLDRVNANLQASSSRTVDSDNKNWVTSGHRATIKAREENAAFRLVVLPANEIEIKESLSWQNSLLTLGGDSLSQISHSFEQKTGIKLIIADPGLNDLRIGGQFPSNDVKSFLRLLNTGYDIEWYEREDGALIIGQP